MRPIDADALKQQVESPYTEYPIMIQIRKALKDFIDAAPTIDVPDTNVGDMISRAEAIDAICGVCEIEKGYHKCDGYWCEYLVALRKLPSAEPRWIPVSERLPDDLEEVNVTWVNHKPESYYESIKDEPFTATAVFYKGKWYWWTTYTQDLLGEYGERCNVGLMDENIEVIAWMPLPEPWEGADDEH